MSSITNSTAWRESKYHKLSITYLPTQLYGLGLVHHNMPGFSNHYHKHWESWCPHSHAVNSPSLEYEYEWPRSRYQKPSELDEVGKLLMQSSSVYLAGYCQTLACFLYTKYSTWSKVQESQCHSLFCGFTLAILYYPYPNSSTRRAHSEPQPFQNKVNHEHWIS
jgi:hypothetical protein